MSGANIVHSGYGLRCEKLDKPLNLGWGWTIARCCTGPGAANRVAVRRAGSDIYRRTTTFSSGSSSSEWCEEPQALTLFGQVQSDVSIVPLSGSYRYG